MKRNRRSISRGRLWICLMTALVGLAVLLVIGPAMTAMAGPTQEKGQEETKEKKDKPKKYTNSDLKKAPRSSDSGGEAGGSGEEGIPSETGEVDESGGTAAEQTDPVDGLGDGDVTDSQGRGEAYWRQAMADARGAVTAAKAGHDRLQSEMNRSQVDFTAIDDPAARAVVDTRLQELYGLLDESKKAVADAEQAVRDLEEDARRSGALPGWLR